MHDLLVNVTLDKVFFPHAYTVLVTSITSLCIPHEESFGEIIYRPILSVRLKHREIVQPCFKAYLNFM